MSDLWEEIKIAINRASAENASNTPDWILAQYLTACLAAFDVAVQQRETWYGRDARPSEKFTLVDVPEKHEEKEN